MKGMLWLYSLASGGISSMGIIIANILITDFKQNIIFYLMLIMTCSCIASILYINGEKKHV